MELLLKNINFVQKSKFFRRIQILSKGPDFAIKIEILAKNLNRGTESKVQCRIELLAKNKKSTFTMGNFRSKLF